MRDRLKDKSYFEKFIQLEYEDIDRYLTWIQSGKTPPDRINVVKRDISWSFLKILIAKYSSGLERNDFVIDYKKAVEFMDQSWDGFWLLKEGNPIRTYNQYILSAYDQMLWMLSIGYLIDISEEIFSYLIKIIDKDNVKDKIFEFIISAKIKSRGIMEFESYTDYFDIPDLYNSLRNAITENNNQQASTLIKRFLEKEWYQKHKIAGWYNSHKSKYDSYFGYWSFESAAIVKIKQLKDTAFRDNLYYPSDLVKI